MSVLESTVSHMDSCISDVIPAKQPEQVFPLLVLLFCNSLTSGSNKPNLSWSNSKLLPLVAKVNRMRRKAGDSVFSRGIFRSVVCVTCTETASASLLMVTACSCPLARFLTLLLRTSASLLLSSRYLTSSMSAHTNQQKIHRFMAVWAKQRQTGLLTTSFLLFKKVITAVRTRTCF